MKKYKYVGPKELLDWIGKSSSRCIVENEADLLSWIKETHQLPNSEGETITTFIVDVEGHLWVADRRSEHVVCADGGPVLSAGEMTFRVTRDGVEVVAVTNQSTGFCPEPESWPVVAVALDEIGLAHPSDFSTYFQFRLCRKCNSVNIVKDDWFVCGICDADLDLVWNFSRA